jgi:hypothetical protein
MRKSFRVCVAALAALFFVIAAAARPTEAATAADCIAKPTGPAPKGQHWYFSSDRETKRRCWFLAQAGLKVASRQRAPRASKQVARAARQQPADRPEPRAAETHARAPEPAAPAAEPEAAPAEQAAAAAPPNPTPPAAAAEVDPAAGRALLAEAFAMRARTAGADDPMTGARGAPEPAAEEDAPAADAVWPPPPAHAAAVLPTAPAILLAILAGSLVFAGIALRLMMRPRRRA